MADNQIIAASLKVDSEEAVKNVLRLKGEIVELEKEVKKHKAGSEEQLQAYKSLAAKQNELGAASKMLGGNFKNFKEQLTSIPGPANQLTGSLGGVNQAFNILKANPIIGVFALLAGLVVALFQKFKNMEAVSDSLGKAFGALSGLFNTFMNKVLTPLIDGFTFLVDLFVKSATFIADIFSPGLAEAAERSGELADALDDLNDAESASAISRAESNRKLQEARDLANDANVPIKERIQALKDAAKIEKEEFENSIKIATERAKIMLEQIAIELGARKELVDAIRNGSIDQLKAARNEIMAMQNVDKQKLKAIDELIIQAENQGAAFAKINKKTESSITALEKEEAAKRKEARDKAIQQHKEQEQKLNEFRTKLRQLQQDNEISQIKDGYQRELRQLEQKLENDKRANEQAVKDQRLTRAQVNQLNEQLEKQANIKRADIQDKHNKETEKKEQDFQEKIAKLKQEISLGGIVDQRKLEQEQIKVIHEQQLSEAQKQYADDAEKLNQVKNLIDEKYRQDKKKLDSKFAEEDAKAAKEKALKELDNGIKKGDEIINDPNSELSAKREALESERSLIQKAFDDKIILEEDYNAKVDDLAKKRMLITQFETAHKKAQTEEVAGALNNLMSIVGKQTIAGKALGIATALINTYQGASEAIKQKSTLPSPFDAIAKAANVAAIIAMGLRTVKSITSVQVPGGGGASASAPDMSPAAPIAPTQSSTRIDQSSIQGIGDATSGRTYVLDADVQNNADRNARINRAARLGG